MPENASEYLGNGKVNRIPLWSMAAPAIVVVVLLAAAPAVGILFATVLVGGFGAKLHSDWSNNVVKAAEKELNEKTAALVADVERLEYVIAAPEAELRSQAASYCGVTRQQWLGEITIDALRASTTGRLPVSALRGAGIDNAAAVLAYRQHTLTAIRGIGEAGARHTLAAAHQAQQALATKSVPLPSPELAEPQSYALVQSAGVVLDVRNASDLEVLEDARSAAAASAAGQMATSDRLSFVHFVAARLLGSAFGSPDELNTRIALESEITAGLIRERIWSVGTAIGEVVQRNGQAVANDYMLRSPEYLRLLEEFLGGADVAGAKSRTADRRGGLPNEIASRVEALDLQVDGLDASLRGYQEFGAQYQVVQKRTIIGDEMGLGKTIETLAAMVHLTEAEEAQNFVVVAPAGIIRNWISEAQRFTDLATHLAHGAQKYSAVRSWQGKGGILVTSYGTLSRLELGSTAIDMFVADEAHYVKNPAAQRTKAVAAVMAGADRVSLLTGTPMENTPEEFLRLLKLVQPGLDVPLGGPSFTKSIAPAYLRRNQEDVLTELPEKMEIDQWVELTKADRNAYDQQVRSRNMMGMRSAATVGGLGGTSAKLTRLDDLLDEYREEGQKVIVFSYFHKVLDTVQQFVGSPHRIDGSIGAAARMEIIEAFSSEPGHAVLVSQIEAGGVGLNIQAASVVVIMEPQYKPTTEWQAIARAYRMGQQRRVVVHRLLARESCDERIVGILRGKSDSFESYARQSTVKDASLAATDISDASLVEQVMQGELERLGLSGDGVEELSDSAPF